MKGYKAFSSRGKQYAENTVFEEENAKNCGMNFCKNPLDVLDYYPLVDDKGNVAEFAEVEALGSAETDDGKRFCTKKMKIGTKLSLSQFIKAGFDVAIKSQIKVSDGEILAGGDDVMIIDDDKAKLVGDNGAKIVGGCGATLVGRYCTKLVGGNYATLIGDDSSKLVGGNGATVVGGDDVTIIGDDNAELAGGDCAKIVGGYVATLIGGYDTIIVGDNGSIAKGKKGSIIVLVERNDDMNIVNFKAVQVDGEEIKEDVLYKLEKGEFVEVEE